MSIDARTPRPDITQDTPWSFPTPRVTHLDNGLQVWVFDLPGQHVVALDLVQPIALDAEAPEREGVGMLTLRTSDEGTLEHPGPAIAAALESVGAAFSGHAGHSATTASLDVPATRLDHALPLFAEIVQRPAFDADDVARHQALRQAEIAQSLASGAGCAALALRRLRWDETSRSARPAGGRSASVAAVTPDDVTAFHRDQWGPEGSVLVVGGDFPSDPMARLDELFGTWRPAAQERATASEDRFAAPSGVVHLVHRPEAVQIDLRIGGQGLDRHDPRWPALQVASLAIGGSFMSRLNKVLREERGYTYGIHLAASPQRRSGTWTVSASIRTDVAADALGETLRLLDVGADPLTEREVDDAITQIVGVSPLRNDTAEAIVGQASALAAAGFDADQVNRHRERVRAVNAEQASDAAAQVLAPATGHVVVVGNADALLEPLRRAGHTVELLEL